MNLQQGDVKLFQTANDGNIEIINGVATMSGGLETSVYLSLFGGNESDDGQAGSVSDSWWGNVGEVSAKQYRSKTQNLLRSIAATSNNLIRIQDAVMSDIQWLIDLSIASSVDVSVTIPAHNAVHIDITILAEGIESKFTFTENWKATQHDIKLIEPPGVYGGKESGGGPPGPSTPFLDVALALNVFHYTRLGDSSGLIAVAEVGANLAYLGAVTFSQPGMVISEPLQPSISIAGAATVDYSGLPGGGLDVISGTNGWTMAAWFSPSSLPQSFGTILVDEATFAMYVNGSNMEFYFGGSNPSSTTLVAGNNYFGLMTYDGISTVTMYLNGVNDGVVSVGAGSIINPTFTQAGRNSASGEAFSGNLQELLIFDYELTAAEQLQLYNAGI